MGKGLKALLIIIVLVVAVSFGYKYFIKKGTSQNTKPAALEKMATPKKQAASPKGSAKPTSLAQMATPVEIVAARKGDLELTLNATGDVAAKNQVTVFSKVEGRIVELLVDGGDRVKQGQLLARVEDDALKARVAETKAALEVARARWAQMEAGLRPQELEQARDAVQEAEADYMNAELNLVRARELFKTGFISPQKSDEATLRHTTAKANLNTAREKLKMAEEGYRLEDRQAALAQLHQAEANLRLAEINLTEAKINAPIEGIISERLVDMGAFVHASIRILNIVDMDAVKILINIAEKDIPTINPGQLAQVVTDAHPDLVFRGRVEKISPVVDRESRTAEVELLVPNNELKLKPGMFTRVKMVLARREGSIIAPADALRSADGQAYLFINENGKAVKRKVALGINDGNVVEIVGNLREGEEIIVAGFEGLKDASPVKVVNRK